MDHVREFDAPVLDVLKGLSDAVVRPVDMVVVEGGVGVVLGILREVAETQ